MSKVSQKSFFLNGLIIGRKDFYEADHLVNIFTLENGLTKAVVKGAKKCTSKLGGSTELFSLGYFGIAKGKNLDIITSAKTIEHFQKAKENLKDISMLFFICEFLNKFLPQEVPNKPLYEETTKVFEKINAEKHGECLSHKYIFKTLIMLGYGPSLTNCVICRKNTKETDTCFDFQNGGVICSDCSGRQKIQIMVLSKDVIKILKFIEKNNVGEYSRLSFDAETGEQLSVFTERYLSHVYQKKLKSPDFIRDIKSLR